MGNRSPAPLYSNQPLNPNPLLILTYNIWFQDGFHKPPSTPPSATAPPNESVVNRGKRLMALDTQAGGMKFQVRMAAIVEIILASNADVVNLQEVTPWSYELITCHPSISELYVWSNNPLGRYGVLQLALKSRLPTFQTVPMPTHMGRDLLAVQVCAGDNKSVLVCSAHFESLSSASIRKEQLQSAAAAMSQHPNSILCGDFNFCSYRNYDRTTVPLENKTLIEILTNYDDLWSTLIYPGIDEQDGNTTPRAEEKGYTFDNERNLNIRQNERMRYDRILAKVVDVVATGIVIVGDEEIEDDGGRKMHPSDHFGLVGTFEVV